MEVLPRISCHFPIHSEYPRFHCCKESGLLLSSDGSCALMLCPHVLPSCWCPLVPSRCALTLCPHVVPSYCALILYMYPHVVPTCCALMLCIHVVHSCCALTYMQTVPSCWHLRWIKRTLKSSASPLHALRWSKRTLQASYSLCGGQNALIKALQSHNTLCGG